MIETDEKIEDLNTSVVEHCVPLEQLWVFCMYVTKRAVLHREILWRKILLPLLTP